MDKERQTEREMDGHTLAAKYNFIFCPEKRCLQGNTLYKKTGQMWCKRSSTLKVNSTSRVFTCLCVAFTCKQNLVRQHHHALNSTTLSLSYKRYNVIEIM